MAQPEARPQELRFTRRYPVACEKVWRAWTDPQALSEWFGPGEPDSVLVAELDVRVGGRYRIRFRMPDGEENEVGGHERFVDAQARANHERGWTGTFAKLDAWITSTPPA